MLAWKRPETVDVSGLFSSTGKDVLASRFEGIRGLFYGNTKCIKRVNCGFSIVHRDLGEVLSKRFQENGCVSEI